MSNKNYVKGRAFEYRVMKYFRDLGYYCIRSYGSKGLFDFIAVPPNTDRILPYRATVLVQCKTNGYVAPKERQELFNAALSYMGNVIIAYNENKRLKFKAPVI